MSALAACGAQKKSSGSLPAFVLNGDPSNLLKGTVANTTSPFTLDTVELYQNDFPAHSNKFVSRTRNTGMKSEQQIEDASRSGGTDAGGSLFYRFSDKGGGAWQYAADGGPSFGFEEKDGRLELTDFDGRPAQPVHYSVRSDHRVFSLLFKTDAGTSDEAMVYYNFANGNETPDKPAGIDSKFITVLGPGKTVRWDQDVNPTICGDLGDEMIATVKQAINTWLEDGKIGKRTLTIHQQASCPPFSDVDNHGIFFVNDYIVDDSTEYTTLGLTLPGIDNSQRLLMSDVFVFSQSHRHLFGDDPGNKYLRATVAHEFGHFLGLGHVFAKDGDGAPLYQSVMSYDQVLEPTAYDHEAIRALYD